MKSKREEAAVGLFVLVAAALMIGTILAVRGLSLPAAIPHYTYFKSAAVFCGAMVRYEA